MQLLATTPGSGSSSTSGSGSGSASSSNISIVSLKAKQSKVAELDTSSKAPTVRSYLDDFLSHIDEGKHPKCYNCINSHSTINKDNSCKSCFINECVKLLQLYAEQPKKQKIVVQLVCKFLVNAFTWNQVQPIIAPITELLVSDTSSAPLFNIARYFFQIMKQKQTIIATLLPAVVDGISNLRSRAFVIDDDRISFVRHWIIETLHLAEDCFDQQQQQQCHTFLRDCGLQSAPKVTFSPTEEEQRYHTMNRKK